MKIKKVMSFVSLGVILGLISCGPVAESDSQPSSVGTQDLTNNVDAEQTSIIVDPPYKGGLPLDPVVVAVPGNSEPSLPAYWGGGGARNRVPAHHEEEHCKKCCWSYPDRSECACGDDCVSITLPSGVSPVIVVPINGTTTITYIVTNNTCEPIDLVYLPIDGVTQTSSVGSCNFPGSLAPGQSCNLTLLITGSAVPEEGIDGGPVLCNAKGDGTVEPQQCSQPCPGSTLSITATNNVPAYIAALTSYTNSMTYQTNETLPSGSTPWGVTPAASLLWKILAHLFFDTGTNIPASANLFSLACGAAFSGASFCAIVGNNGGAPFVMQSFNGGMTFSPVSIANLPATGSFSAVSCTTNPSGVSTCVAIGMNTNLDVPFFAQTTDSGATWSIVTTFDLSQAMLTSVNCLANGSTTLCQVTGHDDSVSSPVIYNYTPQAGWLLWSLSPDILVSPSSITYAPSCDSLPSLEIVCIMGLQNNGALPTVIKSSVPGSGIGYSAAAVVNPVVDGPGIIINATAAALNLNTGTVYGIAVGTNGTVPFILQDSDITDDSGWNIVLPSAELGVFVSASCVPVPDDAVYCGAAGSNGTGAAETPFLAQTQDAGDWFIPVTYGTPSSSTGFYEFVSCSLSANQPFCFTGGEGIERVVTISNATTGVNAAWQYAPGISSILLIK